ncbi:hypothetical protein TW95_gp1239 [Pandoravirus inopinatum]|uniref:Uncharacterized protein n=1 Tax=Pandoravirus inopinatum TaxID=1605721 RepID=A0A0B5IYL1_9VIRU|nr:hypothetical protein TW95_gp1239 [Pandoravirus inopinatum]AJF97973.1 hypothetical protein [Pandoravirus inopinatum]
MSRWEGDEPSSGVNRLPPELLQAIVAMLGHPRDLAAAQIASRLFAGPSAPALAAAWACDRAMGRLLRAGAPLAVVRDAIARRRRPLGRGFIKHAVTGGHISVLRAVCDHAAVRSAFFSPSMVLPLHCPMLHHSASAVAACAA